MRGYFCVANFSEYRGVRRLLNLFVAKRSQDHRPVFYKILHGGFSGLRLAHAPPLREGHSSSKAGRCWGLLAEGVLGVGRVMAEISPSHP